MTSGSSSSRSPSWPSSSASRAESSDRACGAAFGQRRVALVHERARRSGTAGICRTGSGWPSRPRLPAPAGRRCRAAASVSAGTSKTSRRHSRTVSSTIGNDGYWLATSSSCADRWRCCHSGVRRPGLRRGSSSARLAHSRNRDANSALAPTSAVMMSLISSGSSSARSAGGGSSESGHPDEDAVVGVQRLHVHAAVPLPQPGRDGQRPRRVHPVAVGLCSTTRQSPSSSRNRSTTRVRSSGTWPVAAR